MTTIITRLFPDAAAAAQAVVAALANGGINADAILVILAAANGGADAAMKAARVSATAAAYGKAMKTGKALLIVQLGFNPAGAARTAIKIVNRHASIHVGLADEDEDAQEYPSMEHGGSVMNGAPLLSNPFARAPHGHIFGANPVMQSRPRTLAIRGGAHMSKVFWPMKLVSQPRAGRSAIAGGGLMSDRLGIATLLRR